jgi:hypothetical protein
VRGRREAEIQVKDGFDPISGALALLLLGSLRGEQLDGVAARAFNGHFSTHPVDSPASGSSRGVYLDPRWMAIRRREYASRRMGDFACALVDDMLAQSHRVALRKLRFDRGRMVLHTKMHDREGRYFADRAEGSGNVGMRVDQVAAIGTQLGLFDNPSDGPAVTETGCELLELPR